jgi:hypothetical protein
VFGNAQTDAAEGDLITVSREYIPLDCARTAGYSGLFSG